MSGTELVIPEKMREANTKLAAVLGYDPMLPVLAKASTLLAVREWLANDEVFRYVNALQNTDSGFQTDQKEEGYDKKAIVNCVATALVNGFQLVNNEFNIIAGRFYGAKNGWKRKCQQYRDEKYEVLFVSEPEAGEFRETPTMVSWPMEITYVMRGISTNAEIRRTYKKRVTVVKKSKDTPDAWLGKGAKRLYQSLFSQLSGADYLFDDHAGDGFLRDDAPAEGRVNGSVPAIASAPARSDAKPAPENPQGVQDADFTEVKTASPKPAPEPAAEAPAALGGKRPPVKEGK